jgi:hypothetical protein
MPGVAIQGCAALDPMCGNPTPPVITDDAGLAHMSVAGDFTGFYQISRSDAVTQSLYPGRLLAHELQVGYPDGPLLTKSVQLLGLSLGIDVNLDPDAGLGHLFFTTFDCDDRHTDGVTVSVSPGDGGTAFYVVGGIPNTGATATDPGGSGGYVNLPAGRVQVRATFADDGGTIGTYSVFVHSAASTVVWIRPRVR